MNGGTPRLSFDRAAGFYDATRGLPDAVADALADLLAAELVGRGPCLEVGAGTGRIALPLWRRGIRLVGADISEPMLRRLVSNAGDHLPFPLLIGDASRLPLLDGALGAVMASHVLHLIVDWRDAVEEAVRVLRGDGVLLVDFGGPVRAPWHRFAQEVLDAHGVVRRRPGVSDPAAVTDLLGTRARTRALHPVTLTTRRSLARDLDEWERQVHSWTWSYGADRIHDACEDVRTRAAAGEWPLEEEVEIERTIQWWAFDVGG